MKNKSLSIFISTLVEKPETRVEAIATAFHEKLKELESLARGFADELKKSGGEPQGNPPETIAQSILAMRHIEDARMRYEKVIQYSNDVESIYDKEEVRDTKQAN